MLCRGAGDSHRRHSRVCRGRPGPHQANNAQVAGDRVFVGSTGRRARVTSWRAGKKPHGVVEGFALLASAHLSASAKAWRGCVFFFDNRRGHY